MKERIEDILDELAHDPRSDLEAAASVRSKVDRRGVRELLVASCSRALGRDAATHSDVVRVLADYGAYGSAVRAVSVDDDSELWADFAVLVARFLLRTTRLSYGRLPSEPATVQSLDRALFDTWTSIRSVNPHEWLYHPRKTKLSAFVLGKVIDDLRAASVPFEEAAAAGAMVGDVNVEMQGGDRRKALDLVVGPSPTSPIAPAAHDRLRRAGPSRPYITLEVKACMTAHRQSTPRLLDELAASLDVVKAQSKAIIPVAIIVVNISEVFTNPLHLPGPNRSKRSEIERLFRRIVERIPLDSGSGRDHAYGAIGVAVVDTDNEKHLSLVDATDYVPSSHTYAVAIARAATLFERIKR